MFNKKLVSILSVALLVATWIGATQLTQTTISVSGSEFNAGRIIDDELFYDGADMSTAQIQTFLEARMPECDTYGEEIYSGTMTRAEYAATRDEYPPFDCLRDYSTTYDARAADSLCSAIPAGTKTAAQVIHEVSEACDVSAKALLVMIEKESGLLTDAWPWVSQYRVIMGYGCPDTGPGYTANCDDEYYGYYNQMYNAARQLQNYRQNPQNYRYRAGETIDIQYHPNPSCGDSAVTLLNSATAGLYNYTPYQPNQESVNSFPGAGNSCSSYGNRNFWFMYNNWFGSTKYQPDLNVTQSLKHSPAQVTSEDFKKVSFTVKNNDAASVELGKLLIAVRSKDGSSYNYPVISNLILAPGEDYQYSYQQKFPAGDYSVWIAYFDNRSGQWSRELPESITGNIIRERNFTVDEIDLNITQSLKHSPLQVSSSENKKVSFKIKNNEPYSIELGKFLVAVRDENGNAYNYPVVSNVILGPNEEYTYNEQQSLPSGSYSSWIAYFDNRAGEWTRDFPISINTNIVRDRVFQVD